MLNQISPNYLLSGTMCNLSIEKYNPVSFENIILNKRQRLLHRNTNACNSDNSREDLFFIEKATSIIYFRLLDVNFDVNQISQEICIPVPILRRKIKNITELSLFEFICSIKINHAKQLLSNAEYNISEIAFNVGFKDPKYFSRCFKKIIGITPKEFRASLQTQLTSTCYQKNADQFLKLTINKINNKISDTSLNFDQLAYDLNVSKATLYRKLKSNTGLAPCELINSVRIKHSAELLKSGKNKIYDVAYASGFNDPKYFSKCFKSEFGISPTEFQLLSTID
ncbi:MAG: AraC family transcriptional regulator [Paludibacter sp.]